MKSLFFRNPRARLLFPQNPPKTPSLSPLHKPISSFSTFVSPHGLSESSPSSIRRTPNSPLFAFSSAWWIFTRRAHSLYVLQREEGADEEANALGEEEDSTMNEFLSRFVFVMREKVSVVYPLCNKDTINGMLMLIVQKVVAELERGSIDRMVADPSASATPGVETHDELSQDLWETVWEVSNVILGDMRKERKREEMKKCLQSEDVKEMCRFAREVGVRGDMLREMRLKWAEEKFSEREFYRGLERLKAESEAEDVPLIESSENFDAGERASGSIELPQRHGKIKYKIYGLDMSKPEWGEVADRLHDAEKVIFPEEPKLISGKCKLVMHKILSLTEKDDPSAAIAEWKELLEPRKVDWLALLEKLKENNPALYFKVAELILDEKSFSADIRDYSMLIDGHAKGNRLEDAERILEKMIAKGITPDILIHTLLVHIYSKAGNLERTKAAFENIRSHGFHPDARAYNSMIMAYVNADEPKGGEALVREMEARDLKPTKEIYLALLRAFAQRGHYDGAQRIVNTMQFAGFQPDLESCTLLVEAYGQAGDPDQARNNFDFMINTGHKPDDRSVASMISAYERKNLLDKAVRLLLDLEKDGFEAGVATYTVLVDWFGKLQLIDEAEQILNKIAEKGKAPFKINISLCDMYARAGIKNKALEALGILEGKKEELSVKEFERLIHGLLAGGLADEAEKIHESMKAQGHPSSESIRVALMAGQVMTRQGQTLTFSRYR